MNRRPLVLAGCGFLIIVVGLVVLAVSRDQSPSASADGPPSTTPVVVAVGDIPVNAKGADIVGSGGAKVQATDTAKVTPGALTDVSQLTGREFRVAKTAGQQITASDLTRPPLRSSSVSVPAGTEAVAVNTPFTPGGAGYFAPGDHVNVLAAVDTGGGVGSTYLVAEDIEVLDVSAEVPPRVAAQNSSASTTSTEASTTTVPTSQSSLTYLLAIPTDQVEKVVQASSYHKLYLSLPADNATPRKSNGASDSDIQKGQP